MRTVVILGDGMADRPIAELGGHTPLEVAEHPNMDRLCCMAKQFGMAVTVPDGMPAGSDVANLSVFGFDPKEVYTGRSPLEAASIGLSLCDTDVTCRCNFVTLSDEDSLQDATMLDYAAGEISTDEADELITCLNAALQYDGWSLHTGISYRHILLMRNAEDGDMLTPPHDISGQPVLGRLPTGPNGQHLREWMELSYRLLKEHPVNKRRVKEGKMPANCIWFWGEGRRPKLPNYQQQFGRNGAVISAVDLIRGIGLSCGMRVIKVDGATGTYETNFRGKADACIQALLDGFDFVYLHLEAPDECGHQGLLHEKIYSIEQIDQKVLGPIWQYLDSAKQPYRILLLPDHPTPIALRTHTGDPIPFALFESADAIERRTARFTESCAENCEGVVIQAHRLLN